MWTEASTLQSLHRSGRQRRNTMEGPALMPIVLQPLPRRIHRTHENFALGRPVALSAPPGADETILAALRESLEPLFPEIHPAESPDAAAPSLQLALFDGSRGVPEG